jgi:hypothetical protein
MSGSRPVLTGGEATPAGYASWSEPVRVLRRLEWLAAGYGAAGALVLLTARRSASGALVLTLAAAASIVAFRGLQGLVGEFAAGEGAGKRLPDETPHEKSDTRKRLGRRNRRLVWLRFSLLTLAPLVSLWMDSERALALVMGFSVLPVAMVTEGLLQLAHALIHPRAHP